MAKIKKKVDFSGQPIYVGIDVHKKKWSIGICTQNRSFRPFSQAADPSQLLTYLHENFPRGDYHSAYEAGFSGFGLHAFLKDNGVNSIVIHPGDVPTTDREAEFKTDSRDARKIAEALRSGQLQGIHIPGRQRQEERQLIRFRKQLRKDLVRQKCRIRMMLAFYGIHFPDQWDRSRWDKGLRQWLWELELQHPEGTDTLRLMMGQFEYIRGIRNHVKSRMLALSNKEAYLADADLLQTVPGFSRRTAVRFLAELGDIGRFGTLDRLCSYIGLVPGTRSSGETQRAGRLTYRGHTELRMMMVEAAWVAIGVDPALEQAYAQLRKRLIAQKAIVKIARKLLARIRFVLIHRVNYEKGTVG